MKQDLEEKNESVTLDNHSINLEEQEVIHLEKAIDCTQIREIDILNLPPRKEVHSSNNGRAQIKWSWPFMRLSLVIILLLASLIGAFYLWGDDIINVFYHQK